MLHFLGQKICNMADTSCRYAVYERSRRPRYVTLAALGAHQLPQWYNLLTIGPSRFGLVATLLEMVPVASVLFSFTNTGMLHIDKQITLFA